MTLYHSEKVHPIKFYPKYKRISPFQELLEGEDFIYLIPLELCLEVLDSGPFYEAIPKTVLVNNTLSHSNSKIIQKTLTIVSDHLS